MNLIRPELRDALWRWREVIAAGIAVAAGVRVALWGGWVLIPLGAVIAALGAGTGLIAFRRLRFAQGTGAPGIVEVDEAQISYFGPDGGGFVSVTELTELRIAWANGRRHWRLKQADGQALLIPVEAVGADRLFDAFAALPGMGTQDLITALDGQSGAAAGRGLAPVLGGATVGPVIWRRQSLLALT